MADQQIKYTTDGKKVVVLGNLNSQEKIVQEIFIIDGSEIPSGEHFVVKSLHDAPAVSYKEKTLKELEERYEREHKSRNLELEKLRREYDIQTACIKAKLTSLRQLDTSFNEQQLDQLIDFLSGDMEYIVLDYYGDMRVVKYDQEMTSIEYGRFDSIRLASVFGRTNGELSYKINHYYDGSGSWSEIIPCKTEQQGIDIIKGKFDVKVEASGLTDALLKTATTYGFKISEEVMDTYKKMKNKYTEDEIARAEKRIAQLKEIIIK